MRAKSAIALAPLLVACGVTAGCSAAARPATGNTAAGSGTALNCGMVVDPDGTGYLGGGPLTAGRAVAMLTGPRPAGWTARIASGTLSSTERRTLDIVAAELIGYSGSRLSADAAVFARAELNYSPNGLPVDTAYARPLAEAVAALERDCPSGLAPSRGSRLPASRRAVRLPARIRDCRISRRAAIIATQLHGAGCIRATGTAGNVRFRNFRRRNSAG